jgi:hypothetical protein
MKGIVFPEPVPAITTESSPSKMALSACVLSSDMRQMNMRIQENVKNAVETQHEMTLNRLYKLHMTDYRCGAVSCSEFSNTDRTLSINKPQWMGTRLSI